MHTCMHAHTHIYKCPKELMFSGREILLSEENYKISFLRMAIGCEKNRRVSNKII